MGGPAFFQNFVGDGKDFFFFFWVGGEVSDVSPLLASLSFFFLWGGGGDSAFALVLVGRLTPFFFSGVGGKSVIIPLLIFSLCEGQFGFSPLFSGEVTPICWWPGRAGRQ